MGSYGGGMGAVGAMGAGGMSMVPMMLPNGQVRTPMLHFDNDQSILFTTSVKSKN